MSRTELVIFDWAGTTVDYGCFAPVQAFLEVFKAAGVTPTLSETREPMGMLKREHIKTMLQMPRIKDAWVETHKKEADESDIDALYNSFEEKLMSILDQFTDIKPGVIETIDALRSKGIKIGSTTGYTDKMMAVVAPAAKEGGYAPDFMITPDSTESMGRPYPYMVFENMKALKASSVKSVIKVGDTISDIKEGKSAGVATVGVLEGSSEMGLTQAEYEELSAADKKEIKNRVKARYLEAGADYVIDTIEGILDIV